MGGERAREVERLAVVVEVCDHVLLEEADGGCFGRQLRHSKTAS